MTARKDNFRVKSWCRQRLAEKSSAETQDCRAVTCCTKKELFMPVAKIISLGKKYFDSIISYI